MGKLNGNDYITVDNMNDIEEYLKNNFNDVDVKFEEEDNTIYIILDNKKYQLFPNTKVSDLIGSFDQMYGKKEEPEVIVDNNQYYHNRNIKVREYRIDIDEELYGSICDELNTLSSDVSMSMGNYDPSMLSGKLGKFYNGLGIDNNKDVENIKGVIEDLSLKIRYSLELYNNTDQELQYFFNSMVSQVFAYDDFKNGGSVEYLTIEQKENNIRNYIDGLTETYDALWQEYLGIYGQGMNESGIIIESEAADLLVGIMRGFHLGVYDIGCYGKTASGQSYMDYNPLCDTLNFIKENKVIEKLKKYSGGESWEESGMSELNYYVLGYIDSGYLDRHHDNEMSFLMDYFENQNEEFIDEARGKYDYKTSSTLLLDENNIEFIDLLKNRIKSQTDVFNYDEINETVKNKDEFDKTLASLSSQIYNLKQYEKLMPYEDIRKDPEFLKYMGREYENTGNFAWYDQSELAMYHYVYDKEGFDAANKYLKVLDDAVNQRKGYVAAVQYVELLNAGHEIADIANELSPILGIAADGLATIFNTAASGIDGLGSGLFTFMKGFYNLAHADGVRDASDYTLLFKSTLMQEENEFNQNMSDWQRQLYYHNNQIMSSVGNMAIPCLLSATGVPALGKAALFLSSMGNATENTLQEGYSGPQAYLFGALSASLELATESILGSLPGLGGKAPENIASLKGVQFLKALGMSMFDEGKEEFIQTYAEAGLKYMILGEPFDLSATTGEAFQAFIYGAITSGIMNVGSTIPVRLKNGGTINVDTEAIKTISETEDAKIVNITEDGNLVLKVGEENVTVTQDEAKMFSFFKKNTSTEVEGEKTTYQKTRDHAIETYGKNKYGLLSYYLRHDFINADVDPLIEELGLQKDVDAIKNNPSLLKTKMADELNNIYRKAQKTDASGKTYIDYSVIDHEAFDKFTAITFLLSSDPDFRMNNSSDLSFYANKVNDIGLNLIEQDKVMTYHTSDDITISVYGTDYEKLNAKVGDLRQALDMLSPELKKLYVGREIKLYDQQDYSGAACLIDYYLNDRSKTSFTSGGGFHSYSGNYSIFTNAYTEFTVETLLQTLEHEGGHALDNGISKLFNLNGDYFTENSPYWKSVIDTEQRSGYGHVSKYGDTKLVEDFAETSKHYEMDKDAFRRDHPERAKAFEFLRTVYDPSSLSIFEKLDLIRQMQTNGLNIPGQTDRVIGASPIADLKSLPTSRKLELINKFGLNSRGDISQKTIGMFFDSTSDLSYQDRMYLYNTFDSWNNSNIALTQMIYDAKEFGSGFSEKIDDILNNYSALTEDDNGNKTIDSTKVDNRRILLRMKKDIELGSRTDLSYMIGAISDPQLKYEVTHMLLESISPQTTTETVQEPTIIRKESHQDQVKQSLDQVVKTMNDKGYNGREALKTYLETGQENFITRTNGARDIVKGISMEDINTYLLYN